MAIDVAAAKATELPSEGRESRNARNAASQTVRMGERNLSSTLWKKLGCGDGLSAGLMGAGEEKGLQFRRHARKQTSFGSWMSRRKVHNAIRRS